MSQLAANDPTAEQESETIIVLAKAPVPGRAKTRLCPPCTPETAALLAQTSLADTLAAVELWGGLRLLALDQCGTDFTVDGWHWIAQNEGGLDVRLDDVFTRVFATVAPTASVFLIGMDTPQISAADLAAAFHALRDHEAAIGPTTDGGYWGIGFRSCPINAFVGVPMSTDHTFEDQCARLGSLGLSVAILRTLSDIDTFDDALRVGAEAPHTGVGQLVARDHWWDRSIRPK